MIEKIIDKSALPVDCRDCDGLNIDLEERMPMVLEKLDIVKPKNANAVKISVEAGMFPDSYLFNVQYGIKTGDDFIPVEEPLKYTSECLPFPSLPEM